MDSHTPCHSAHTDVPRIVGPDNSNMENHSEWTTEVQDLNDEMQMNSYLLKACVVGQTRDPRPIELNLQGAPQSEAPTFAEQVSLDTFGMGAHSVGDVGPYFEVDGSTAVPTGHSAHRDVGCCDKNCCHHSHQLCPALENRIDPRLMEPGGNLDMLEGIGQYNAFPVAKVVPRGDDYRGLMTTRNMRRPPQQLGPAPSPPNNTGGHFEATFPEYFVDMPWTPPTTIEPIFRRYSYGQYGGLNEGTSISNPGYRCSSSSAFGPTISSDTSFLSNVVPLSSYMRPRPRNLSQSIRTSKVSKKNPDHLQVGWRPRGSRNIEPYSSLTTTSSVFGVASTGEQEAGAVMSSFSDCISAPGDMVQMDDVFSPTPSEASTSPSIVPDALICQFEGCPIQFKGRYRRGNLLRHIRLVHNKVKYPCVIRGCDKTFNRQDARLKHYRKHHANDLPFLKPPSARKYRR